MGDAESTGLGTGDSGDLPRPEDAAPPAPEVGVTQATEAGAAPVAETGTAPAADADAAPPAGSGAGPRLLAAAVTLPWVFLYGITGVWAVTLAARAAGRGLRQVDAGYTRFVTPAQLAFVGALLLAAFAVLLACGLLLLFRRRSAAVWLPLLLVAAGLTAGAVWAGVTGGIHPLVWALLFFGLVYVTVVALIAVLQVTRPGPRDRIGEP